MTVVEYQSLHPFMLMNTLLLVVAPPPLIQRVSKLMTVDDFSLVKLLFDANPEAISVTDDWDDLPVDHAVKMYSLEVVVFLDTELAHVLEDIPG